MVNVLPHQCCEAESIRAINRAACRCSTLFKRLYAKIWVLVIGNLSVCSFSVWRCLTSSHHNVITAV